MYQPGYCQSWLSLHPRSRDVNALVSLDHLALGQVIDLPLKTVLVCIENINANDVLIFSSRLSCTTAFYQEETNESRWLQPWWH